MYLTELTESTDVVEVLRAVEQKAEDEFRERVKNHPPESSEYTTFYNRTLSASYRHMAILAFEQRNKLIEAMRTIQAHQDCPTVIDSICHSCLIMASKPEEDDTNE
jgi:hypothetical protein